MALATELARRGLDITLLARNRQRLDEARDHILGVSPRARIRGYPVDVSDFEASRAVVDEVTSGGQPIDVVINSAGIVREGYFETMEYSEFRRVMDIDYLGVLNVTRVCLPHLKASRGRLVNVSSMAGMVGVFGETAYCAAKHAVKGFSEALRREVEPHGVAVVLVCPGEFATPMVTELNTYRTPENDALVHAFPVRTLDEVTREVLAGIDRREPLITRPHDAHRLVSAVRRARAAAGVHAPPGRRGVSRSGCRLEERPDQVDDAAVVVEHRDHRPLVEDRARMADSEFQPFADLHPVVAES